MVQLSAVSIFYFSSSSSYYRTKKSFNRGVIVGNEKPSVYLIVGIKKSVLRIEVRNG